jgi:uncharacterized protein (DUF58 family)
MRNRGIALGLVLVLAATTGLASLASGQLGQTECGLGLEAPSNPQVSNFEPGEQRTYEFTVTNNASAADATGTFKLVSEMPDAWFWSPTEENVDVAAGGQETVTVTARYEGEIQQDATLSAQVQDVQCEGAATSTDPNSDTVSLALTSAELPAPADEGADIPWAWIIFSTLVAGTVVGVPVYYQRRSPSLDVECDESEGEVQPGRGTSYPIRLTNDSSENLDVKLQVTDVQQNWSALTTLPELELGPEESRTVYMMVRAPEEAKPGDLCVAKLGVTPAGGSRQTVKTLTRVDEDAEVDEQPPEPAEGGEPSENSDDEEA